jgi:hypothetical protein
MRHLAEVHTAVATEAVGMKAAVRESEPAVVSATEMGVAATEMPSPEMTAAEMVATAVTPTMSAPVAPTMSAAVAVAAAPTSAKCRTRQDGREHDDGNSNALSRHSILTSRSIEIGGGKLNRA